MRMTKKNDIAPALLDALQFEHWLRYFFLPQPDDAGNTTQETETSEADAQDEYLAIPAEWQTRIQAEYPHFAPLAKTLAESPISLEHARVTVFTFVWQDIGMEEEVFYAMLPSLVDDPVFRRNLDAFHGFVEAESEAEYAHGPKEPVTFAEWQMQCAAWAEENANLRVISIPVYGKPE